MPEVLLHWIPVGAGGNGFVRRNGQAYEWVTARAQRRVACPLFHAALTVSATTGTYVIEQVWPVPRGSAALRGVTATGPVWLRGADRWRTLRYEVRCWQGGLIADLEHSIAPALRVAHSDAATTAVLAQVALVPTLPWGRRPAGQREMWNSNSVIAWVLESAGVDAAALRPADGGRCPGWNAGVDLARQARRSSPAT